MKLATESFKIILRREGGFKEESYDNRTKQNLSILERVTNQLKDRCSVINKTERKPSLSLN